MNDTAGAERGRTAIVFIHGQGQQRPMEDVQELARVVWEAKGRGKTWTVPDARLGMADLGRVTTAAGSGLRVDFFELYWAHLMAGNRFDHFLSWFQELLARPRAESPTNLLTVRQGVIRFIEAITLLALLFTFGVAALLPPTGGLTPAQMAAAFGGWPAPTPADFTLLMTYIAVFGIFAGAVVTVVNELVERGAPRPRKQSLLGLRAKAAITPLLYGLSLATYTSAVLIVLQLIWQGPLLDWGDLRLPLLLGVALSAWLFVFRQLNAAVAIAICLSVLALICALFGSIGAENLWAQSESISPWAASLRDRSRGLQDSALHLFFWIFIFAFLWSAYGSFANKWMTRAYLMRLLSTVVIVAAAAVAAWWFLNFLYIEDREFWGLFATGVTLVVVLLGGAVISLLATRAFLIPVMTDSARYFSRNPEHIDARQQIRSAGVSLLDRLHDPESGYERVIVVAHSLGSAVGYELLMDYWARQSGSYVLGEGSPAQAAFANVEASIRSLNVAATEADRAAARTDFRAAQRTLARALAAAEPHASGHGHAAGKKWLITDFITLGSPLTYASLLLAGSRRDLADKLEKRQLAACPPVLFDQEGEVDMGGGGLTFRGYDGLIRPIHSSLFAPVRWTNHYFKTGDWIIVGDVIGGPIASKQAKRAQCLDLGGGVFDRELDRHSTGKLFAHNEYWRSDLSTADLARHLAKNGRPAHIAALIEALDLDET